MVYVQQCNHPSSPLAIPIPISTLPSHHHLTFPSPIIGGTFAGPRLKGKILDVGADWGLTDIQTGIFSADTRYNFQTDDGAHIFLQTSGPAQPNGNLHLRAVFETGDKKYYWLNNVVTLGVLRNVETYATGFLLRIDVWHVS